MVGVYHGLEGVTERLGQVLTRLVRDHRMRVEWSENKWRSPKRTWSGVCVDSWWILSSMGAKQVPIQDNGCGNFWRADGLKRRTGGRGCWKSGRWIRDQ